MAKYLLGDGLNRNTNGRAMYKNMYEDRGVMAINKGIVRGGHEKIYSGDMGGLRGMADGGRRKGFP